MNNKNNLLRLHRPKLHFPGFIQFLTLSEFSAELVHVQIQLFHLLLSLFVYAFFIYNVLSCANFI